MLIERAPFLEIKSKEGYGVSEHTEIKINAMGLINSIRENGDDHYVYFGSSL